MREGRCASRSFSCCKCKTSGENILQQLALPPVNVKERIVRQVYYDTATVNTKVSHDIKVKLFQIVMI
jgi:hypothetical protein